MIACPDCSAAVLAPEGTWWRCAACALLCCLPNPGFQERFLASDADILLAVSRAGSGKTAAMLMAAARWIGTPGYRAWILREQERDLYKSDGLIDQARALYEAIGGCWYAAELTFRFDCPTGGESSIQLGHIGRNYREDFQGPAAAFLGVNELTQVSRTAFRWFFSRLRSAAGVPVQVRLDANPDADSWVFEDLAAWWIGPDGLPDPTRTGRRRYLAGRDGRWHWGDAWQEAGRAARRGQQDVLAVEYLHATDLAPQIAGSGYEGRTGLLDLDDAASLEDGRWVRRKKGKLLQPEWLAQEVEDAPSGTRWIRAWDLAATAEAMAEHGSSYTAGVLLGVTPDGRIVVGHAVIGRHGAADVEHIVLATAGVQGETHPEATRTDGKRVPIRFCRERAGAGKALADHYLRRLVGWDVQSEVESGAKEVRLRPFVAQAEAGNVVLVRGAWNATYRAHMLALPDRPDDAGDATARALECLTADAPIDVSEGAAAALDTMDLWREPRREADGWLL